MTRVTVVKRAFLATAVIAAIFVPASSSAAIANADDASYVNPHYADAATLAVEGTIQAVADTVRGSDEYAYAVRTDEGVAIAVPASFGESVPVGGRFDGEIALVADVADEVRSVGVKVTAGKAIDGDTAAGQAAIEVVADQVAPVPVASATVAEPVTEAAIPADHHAYVAVITNLPGGTPSVSTIDDMLTYWAAESGDVIGTFTVADTKQYASDAGDLGSSPANIAVCGFDDGMWDAVWSEAEGKFSTDNFGPGSGNHLIVLVPPACGNGGTVGIGTVGDSIVDGGYSIVAVTPGAVHTGAHELGHNFGLGHANLEYCPSASCSIYNYGNIYNVMGFVRGAFLPPALDTAAREFLDLDDNVQNVTSVGSPVPVHLLPRSSGAGLKVVDPVSSAVYFVEYRSGTGRDAGSSYSGGDQLRSVYEYSPGIVITQHTPNVGPFADVGYRTKLLTRRVGNPYLSSLAPTDAFTSSNGAVRIQAGQQNGAAGADLTVTLKARVASAVPTMTPSVARVARIMTAKANTWTPGTSFTYQWRINGVAVAGATGPTFKPPTSSYKRSLSVSVTGSRDGYLPTTRTSAKQTIGAGYLIPKVPAISGTHKVGKTLKVVPGTWAYGPKLTYRWYANGSPISGATKSSYKITKSKKGKYITVRVYAYKTGFVSTSKASLRVSKVR